MRRLFLAAILTLFSGSAWATCPTPLPFTLLNGTVADAGQVMANFNNVWNCGINQANVAITGGSATFTSLSGLTMPWPASFGSTPTDPFRVNINTFPAAYEMPAGILQGITSAVNVRADGTFSVTPWPATGISSYVLNTGNFSNLSSSVALFGAAEQNQALLGTLAGWNVIVQNCAGFGSAAGCPDGGGFNASSWEGGEIDVNIVRTAGLATPTGAVIGLKFIGASTVQPTANSWAIEVAPLGFLINLPWTYTLHSDDAGSSAGIYLGSIAAAGASVASQGIDFRAYNSGSVGMDANQLLQSDGEFILNAPAAGSVALKVNNVNSVVAAAGLMTVNGHTGTTSAAVPGVTSCGSGALAAGGSTDTDGTIVVGSGTVTSCVVSFHAAYNTTPHIVLTGFANNTFWITANSPSGFTFNSASSMGSGFVNYMVIGQ